MDQNPMQSGNTPEQPRQETPPVESVQGQPTQPVSFAADSSAPQAVQPQEPQQPQPAPGPQTTVYSPYPGQSSQQPVQPVYGPPQQSYQPNQQQPYQQQQPNQQQQQYPSQQSNQQQYAPPGNMPPGQPGYQPGYVQAPPKQGGVPVWVWVIGGIVAVLLLACGVSAYVITRAVTTTVEQSGKLFSAITSDMSTMGIINSTSFYSDLSTGQYEAARQFLTPQMKDKYSADKLRADWEKLTASGNTISPNIPDLSQLGSTQAQSQVLTMTLDGSSGKVYTIKLNMKEVSNDWLIDGADPALIPEP